MNIYDQTFSGVTKSGKSASGVSINVKDNLSYTDIKNHMVILKKEWILIKR